MWKLTWTQSFTAHMPNFKESGTAMSALGNTALMGTEKIPSYCNNRMTQLKLSKPFQTQANLSWPPGESSVEYYNTTLQYLVHA